jgi:hypothetical protein
LRENITEERESCEEEEEEEEEKEESDERKLDFLPLIVVR